MNSESRKSSIRRLFERVITCGEYHLIPDIFAENVEWPQFQLSGRNGIRRWVTAFRSAFPDVVDQVVWQVAEGDTVVTFLQLSATHLGPYMGVKETGRFARWNAVGIDKFEGELVVRMYAYFDVTDLMKQLQVTEIPILETTSFPLAGEVVNQ
jgi:predicted ester cyclase